MCFKVFETCFFCSLEVDFVKNKQKNEDFR